ncbi:MAG: hypothetical protein IK152_00875 [Lachnospiraceae bacterium]|nr:hypothetical protein [Lachnospiraceae bacterium]
MHGRVEGDKEMSEVDMLKFVTELNNRITLLCEKYVVMNRADLVADVKAILPDVQKFAMWFLEAKDIGVSEAEKQIMDNNVLLMIKDINEALEFSDSALMYDALECGVAQYLRLFLPEGK